MSWKDDDRIKEIEKALLRAEGAHYALHDVLARALGRLPTADYDQLMRSLAKQADDLDPRLGADRIAGYRDELASIAEEVEHARPPTSGLLGRLRRS
ncbi:hypothetical protein [Novosphingobium guangzhouense]|uniref:Uncharacterized protein n=1 Tax=Novosphingobium guangzhouense TaxID=1850347 RepID=A0A2K2FXY3_9SPHN|nr:hypothetical protein [Novosphingobium guangzhouense]PNU03651.1 hypothetical protein A8V01_22980 [Novosphingobium guangzhouense]